MIYITKILVASMLLLSFAQAWEVKKGEKTQLKLDKEGQFTINNKFVFKKDQPIPNATYLRKLLFDKNNDYGITLDGDGHMRYHDSRGHWEHINFLLRDGIANKPYVYIAAKSNVDYLGLSIGGKTMPNSFQLGVKGNIGASKFCNIDDETCISVNNSDLYVPGKINTNTQITSSDGDNTLTTKKYIDDLITDIQATITKNAAIAAKSGADNIKFNLFTTCFDDRIGIGYDKTGPSTGTIYISGTTGDGNGWGNHCHGSKKASDPFYKNRVVNLDWSTIDPVHNRVKVTISCHSGNGCSGSGENSIFLRNT